MKLCHIVHAHPENFSFSQHICHKTQTVDIWQQTNCWDVTVTKTAKRVQKHFLEFISDVHNVCHWPKHMHSDVISQKSVVSHHVCGAVQLLAPEWFLALSLLSVCSIAPHTFIVKWLKSGEFGGYSYFTLRFVRWPFK